MSVNKFNLDEYKRIRNGFRLKAYRTHTSFGGGLMECVIERKFETLLDLISYIHSLKGHIWVIIANSNNRKTLFGGFVSYFKTQTRDTEFGKMIYIG